MPAARASWCSIFGSFGRRASKKRQTTTCWLAAHILSSAVSAARTPSTLRTLLYCGSIVEICGRPKQDIAPFRRTRARWGGRGQTSTRDARVSATRRCNCRPPSSFGWRWRVSVAEGVFPHSEVVPRAVSSSGCAMGVATALVKYFIEGLGALMFLVGRVANVTYELACRSVAVQSDRMRRHQSPGHWRRRCPRSRWRREHLPPSTTSAGGTA